MNMEEWGLSEFRKRMEEGKQATSNLSQDEDDALTRQARIMEVRNAFEHSNESEQDGRFFTYRKYLQYPELFTKFLDKQSPLNIWYPCTLKTKFSYNEHTKDPFDNLSHDFQSLGQFMVFCKSMLFLDRKLARKIIATQEPEEIIKLSSEIQHFNPMVWKFNERSIYYDGVKAKFEQSQSLYNSLMNTVGTTLVDGQIAADTDFHLVPNWRERNLFGEVMTQYRFVQAGEY
ncbi:NADAR domain-containing protein [Pseudochryseolinea flava]|uniref:NADAR domain-containing protein n=1 Tax=Pseudochryseolinea flava TaxID=2059302 RepID=A0A364XTE7_9BACT|nr:NADAR domain-containing protein [Pseudochryseolinea flava]RAV97631.1 hypothetical protein DQQ10_27500 [Pseudochryseolinea flava]